MLASFVCRANVSGLTQQLAKGLLTGLSQKTRPLDFIKDVYILYKDAPLILDHAGKHFAKLTTLEESEINCPIHSDSSGQGRPLVEHERLRSLWSWYFLKLYTQSYGPNNRWQRDVLDTILADTSLLQNVMLFDMVTFLCEDLDPEVQEVSIGVFVTTHLIVPASFPFKWI